MPGIPDFPELSLNLVVFYRITNGTGKITEKTEFNESLTSARQMKLSQESEASY